MTGQEPDLHRRRRRNHRTGHRRTGRLPPLLDGHPPTTTARSRPTVPDAGVIGPGRQRNLRHLLPASLVSPLRPVDPANEPGNTMYVTAKPDYAPAARHAPELLAPRLVWAIG